MRGNEVFVKFNFKSIGESKSLIIDRDGFKNTGGQKYLMCAGKHDKNGWTIVFKANSYKEAEYIIENNPFKNKIEYTASPIFIKPTNIVC